MNARNVILFLSAATLTFASCKDNSEDEPMNPVTEQILATGLNVGADGVDTTVVFPKSDAYEANINFASGTGNWMTVKECTDAVTGAQGIRIQCAPSDTSLFARDATVNISSPRGNYVLKVNQKPYKLAYFTDSIIYVKNTGGSLVLRVKANSPFIIKKIPQVTGSGENTKFVDTSWLETIYKEVKCNEGQTLEFPFEVLLNTGLGRSADYGITGDSLHNDNAWYIEVRQEPRTLNASETIKFGMFSEPLSVLLGQDEENLSRLRKLTMTGYPTPYDIEYAAKIGVSCHLTRWICQVWMSHSILTSSISKKESSSVPICRGSCFPKASGQFVMRLLPTVRTSRLLFCLPVLSTSVSRHLPALQRSKKS